MSGSRNLLFLAISAIIHVVVLVIIVFANSETDKIYENVEITSYVTPKPKSSVVTPKTEAIKNDNEKAAIATESTEAKTIEAADEVANEQPANDSEITSPAKLLTQVKANRTEAARRADYAGISQVELTIGSDGLVKKVKLRNSLPYGLDEVALRLAQESKFKPAMIKNKPVASAILFKVRFESEK